MESQNYADSIGILYSVYCALIYTAIAMGCYKVIMFLMKYVSSNKSS